MLRTAFQRGRDGALARFGVKIAAVPLARPMSAAKGLATPHAAPAAAPHAPSGPADMSQQFAARDRQHVMEMHEPLMADVHNMAAQHMAQPSPAAPAPTPAAGPSGMQRFMRPVKRGLGLAALGAGGALAYGLHRQNQEDRDKNSLVYAPLQGAY